MVKLERYPILMFTKDLHAQMLSHCREERAKEVCGVLLGNLGKVEKVTPIPNIDNSAALYTMDPVELNRVFNVADESGLELMGIYHSHLGGPAMLSLIDIQKITLDVPIIVVTPTEARCWYVGKDGTIEVPMMVEGKPTALVEKQKVGVQITISEGAIKTFETMLMEWLVDGQKKRALQGFFDVVREVIDRIGRVGSDRVEGRIGIVNQYSSLVNNVTNGLEDYFGGTTGASTTATPYTYFNTISERVTSAVRDVAKTVTEGIRSGEQENGINPRAGELVVSSGFGSSELKEDGKPKPIPHDKHKFKFVSKTPDGKSVYECSVENCDEVLTINGELEGKEVEENGKKGECSTKGDGKDKDIEPPLGGRGEDSPDRASDSGTN